MNTFGESLMQAMGAEKKRGRGHPFDISDETLKHRRNALLWPLEECWAQIGWELQTANTLAAIRKALSKTQGLNCHELDRFRNELTAKCNKSRIAQLRKEIDSMKRAGPKLYREAISAEESLHTVRIALQESVTKEDQADMREALAKREQQNESAKAAWDAHGISLKHLSDELEKSEAYLSQSELLEFIRSEGRYSREPEKFANAMAGLPEVSWRTSAERCAQFQSRPSMTYEMFVVVSAALESAPRSRRETLRLLKSGIQGERAKLRDAKRVLSEDWFYLTSAVKKTVISRLPARALPFRIFEKFELGRKVRSAADRIRAEEQKLSRTSGGS
ncbi:hypothetical protein [Candidatus Korobacter versatilis]|uniref:hypothetical protein n=1 Tax=Candidatus Korobacter versatilis TaxID=658062 RepID=UPI0011D0B58B|nr:hypothetical protein [Candidatus Koribacter versatilis]